MAKPRGPVCNLDCSYCFYLDKEELYPGSELRMTLATLDRFTKQYIDAQEVPEVTFAWQGGEPTLMGLEFFRAAVERQRQTAPAGLSVQNALQTNGTLLDAEWCAFLRENGFLVGLSLDGPRELHDRYRKDKGGRPSFDRVMAAAELMRKERVEFNLLTTVHAANQEHGAEVYRFLRDRVHARFLQFIPIVEWQTPEPGSAARRPSPRSVTGEGYGRFLCEVFDEWVLRDVGTTSVQIFDVALAAWAGMRPGLCVFEPTCGNAVAMEHNGDVYSCDHYVEPSHLLGNIESTELADLVSGDQQRRFGQAKADLPAQCLECEVRFVCNGGCPKNRVVDADGTAPGLNYLCAGYRRFFNHINAPMRMMAGELRAGRPPAAVMGHLRSQRAGDAGAVRVRPNEPCPCGSGRKYKHCHGR